MIRLDNVITLMALAVSLSGYLPLYPWLESFPRWFLPGALLVRFLGERTGFRAPPRMLTVASVALFLAYLLRLSPADMIGPAVNLLVLLLGVRFLGERSSRNYLQLFLLALLCLAASSLYSLDALFMLYLGLQTVLFPVALVLLTCYDGDPNVTLSPRRFRALLFVPLTMLIVSIPLLLCFFVILPRTQFPLWEFLPGSAGKKSGFSEIVQPGSTAVVGESGSVVFRAECRRLPSPELYWRRITLNSFDGSKWSRREPPPGERFVRGMGDVVKQRMFLEPGSSRYLPALDLPGELSGVRGLTCSRDFTLTRSVASGVRSSYELSSTVGGVVRGTLGGARGFYLETPERPPAWFREEGRRLRESRHSDVRLLAEVEELLRGKRLLYATSGLPVSGEPLVAFLTGSRRGNCEFFASSCALLLRIAGVPARLVGGYLGGEYNELGGYYVVTEERAHVWVEAYLEGEGWVRVDPTRWAVNGGEVGASAGGGAFRSLLLAVDTITYFWNRQVITYDLERQITLFTQAGRRLQVVGLSRPERLLRFVVPVGTLFLFWWLSMLVRRRPSREMRLVSAFTERVRSLYGIEAPANVGLRELTAGIHAPDVSRFVEIYNGALYRDRRLLPAEIRELRCIIRNMAKRERSVRQFPYR